MATKTDTHPLSGNVLVALTFLVVAAIAAVFACGGSGEAAGVPTAC